MAKLIVVNNNKCECCGQLTGWNWRIEIRYGDGNITIANDFAFKTKKIAVESAKSFTGIHRIQVNEIDYRSLK